MQTTNSRSWRVLGAGLLALLLALPQVGTVPASTANTSSGDLQRAQRHLDAALGKLESVRARLARVKTEITEIKARTEGLEREVERIAQRVVAAEEAMVDVARAVYMSGSAGVLKGLLGSRSIADLQTGLDYLRSSGRAFSAEFDSLLVDRTLLEERLDQLDAERERAVHVARDMRRLISEIEREVIRRRALVDVAREIWEEARAVNRPPPVPSGRFTVDWDAIAQCESGGNWQHAGRYHGGLQFHPDTWLAYGGGRYARYAYQVSRLQQIAIAEKVLAGQGPSAWPNCFRYGT
jgi:hypothetical protein